MNHLCSIVQRWKVKELINNVQNNVENNIIKKPETLTANNTNNTIKQNGAERRKVVLSGKENLVQTGFVCNKCKASFTTKYHLNRHMKAHNQAKNKFKCFPCNKTFITRIGLSQHNEKNHSVFPNKPAQIDRDINRNDKFKQNIQNYVPNKQNKLHQDLAEMFPSMDKTVIKTVRSNIKP